nr:twin-arginine translocation signal domain-containing protein [uncultured Desulfobulbus sp.]
MKAESEIQAQDQVNLDRRKFIQYTGAVGAALAMGQSIQ